MTDTAAAAPASFRRRLLDGDLLVGTWVKTPAMAIVEVLGRAGLDVACLDAEHAPFDRRDLDACLFAGAAAGLPMLVRTVDGTPTTLLQALDLGATGVLVPHVRTAAEAEAIARAGRFGPGGRGYAGSTRFAGYTTRPMAATLAAGRAETALIGQIEDAEALDAIDAIAAVDGLDALFLGRVDLSVSLGVDDPAHPDVVAAMERVCAAARARDRRLGMFLANPAEIPFWRERGVTLFLIGSDQGFVLSGARALMTGART
ncbi:MAG: aldolase [Alphaproteobacteria bacterium]|jgi:2-keto-3-deoxy-L-rhamnonate aldolase RhmA|nr:aldolase [Alphaproteobacteria bacterium]